MRALSHPGAVLACAVALGACGGGGVSDSTTGGGVTGAGGTTGAAGAATGAAQAAAPAIPSGDWLRYDYDAQRSGVGPVSTGINARNVRRLRVRRVHVDGTVDSSPIELHAIRIRGRTRDVVIVTTTYGRTIALDPGTRARLWEYVPPDIHTYERSAQITTATPIADPGRRYVYAASPDGLIRKLVLATGHELRSAHWPAKVTVDATHEKIASALNISGNSVIATTGGYIGDAPPYQGHVIAIDRSSGRITHVWNSLCSNRHRLIVPSSCPASDAAIWARAGAVIEPGSGRILIATGNAPFNGTTNWGDSVLELSADAGRLLQNWTPKDQAQLNSTDADLGSTAPAVLPPTSGFRLAVQGGKAGDLDLLNLNRLGGAAGGAGPRLGGQLQEIKAPAGAQVFTTPAVWTHAGRTYVFVADDSGTAAYLLTGGRSPRLRVASQNATAGTSPLVAGGLLYVYNEIDGALNVYEPTHLRLLASLPAARGHWNSPIVLGGRIVLPEGNANDHDTTGTLDIYHLPGR